MAFSFPISSNSHKVRYTLATKLNSTIARLDHSTETAVTKVYNDLLLSADQGDVSALCLLDLTAAFDAV